MGNATPWGAGGVIRADKHPVIPQGRVTPFLGPFWRDGGGWLCIPLNTGLQPAQLPGCLILRMICVLGKCLCDSPSVLLCLGRAKSSHGGIERLWRAGWECHCPCLPSLAGHGKHEGLLLMSLHKGHKFDFWNWKRCKVIQKMSAPGRRLEKRPSHEMKDCLGYPKD